MHTRRKKSVFTSDSGEVRGDVLRVLQVALGVVDSEDYQIFDQSGALGLWEGLEEGVDVRGLLVLHLNVPLRFKMGDAEIG